MRDRPARRSRSPASSRPASRRSAARARRLRSRALADPQRAVRRRRHAPAVVRREDDDRAVGEPSSSSVARMRPDRRVQALDHRRVGGVRCASARSRLFAWYFSTRSFLALDRRVDREVRQVEEERPVLRSRDEPHRLVGQPIGEVFAGLPLGRASGSSTARSSRGRLRLVGPRDVEVEAVLLRIDTPRRPGATCRSTRWRSRPLLKALGDRHLLERQMLGPVGHEQLRVVRHLARDPVGDVQPGRVLAGQQAARVGEQTVQAE